MDLVECESHKKSYKNVKVGKLKTIGVKIKSLGSKD